MEKNTFYPTPVWSILFLCIQLLLFQIAFGTDPIKTKGILKFSSSSTLLDSTFSTKDSCDANFEPIIYITNDYPPSYSEVVGFQARRSGYASYHWDFGDGSSDTGASVSHSFAKDGVFVVTLTVKDSISGFCSRHNTFTKHVSLSSDSLYIPTEKLCHPVVFYSVKKDTLRAADQIVRMYEKTDTAKTPHDTLAVDTIELGNGNYSTWNWDFGDNTSGFGQSVTHIYGHTGIFKLTLIKIGYHNPCFYSPFTCYGVPIALCSDTFITYVDIQEVLPYSPICDGDIQLTKRGWSVIVRDLPKEVNNEPILNSRIDRKWNWGDSTYSYGDSVSHTYKTGGSHTVILTRESYRGLCEDSLQVCPYVLILICTQRDTVTFDLYTDSTSLQLETRNRLLSSSSFSLFPNPAQNYLYLSIQNSTEELSLRLYDISGLLVKEFAGMSQGTHRMDVRGIGNGLYFYSLSSLQEVLSKGKINITN